MNNKILILCGKVNVSKMVRKNGQAMTISDFQYDTVRNVYKLIISIKTR